MRIIDIVDEIYMTNEEKSLLETINDVRPIGSFPEREQTIINNLIRKSIISKVQTQSGTIVVIRNDS